MPRSIFRSDDPRFSDNLRLGGVGQEEVMPPGFVSRRQGLTAYLCVLFHDEVQIEIGGQISQVDAGTLVFWDKGRPHYFGRTDATWNHSWVVFGGNYWNAQRTWMEPLSERPRRFLDTSYLHSCFSHIWREFSSFSKPQAATLGLHIQLLLRELGRDVATEKDLTGYADPVERAVSWVEEHLAESITVADLSRRIGYSESRLQQLFRERLGYSVVQYVERQRMQEARYWLTHSGLRISEVAVRVGYGDAFYFSRRFRRSFGLSPRDFRRQQHGRSQEDHESEIPKTN